MDNSKKNNYNKTSSIKYIIAFFIGAIFAACFMFIEFEFLANNIQIIFGLFFLLFIIIGFAAYIITYYKEKIIKYLWGVTSDSISEIKDSALKGVQYSIDRDLENAKIEFEKTATQLGAWYTWIVYQRWVIYVFYVLFIIFASLLGSILFYNQNQLLEKQNQLIDIQTKLVEKQNQRLDQQTYLMAAEMKKPTKEEILNVENVIKKYLEEEDSLSTKALFEINRLLFAFKPYRYLDEINDTLNSVPYSPEKSQILLWLLQEDIDKESWNRIRENVDFNRLDIPQMVFPDFMDLSGFSIMASNFFHSSFRNGNFFKTKLNGTSFKSAFLNNSNFELSFSPNCDFSDASLSNANLKKAALNKSKFNNTNLYQATLDSAILSGCDFRKAQIAGISARGAYVKGLIAFEIQRRDFEESGLSKEDLDQIIWKPTPQENK